MAQTGKVQTVSRISVEFTVEEYKLLVAKVGDWEPGAEADFIHALVMRSLRRRERKAKKERDGGS